MMGDDVTQAELARRVGVSRGYISRVFRGLENLTLETMTKLAIAVGGSVRLHVAPQDRVTRWNDVPSVTDAVAEVPPSSGTHQRRDITRSSVRSAESRHGGRRPKARLR